LALSDKKYVLANLVKLVFLQAICGEVDFMTS